MNMNVRKLARQGDRKKNPDLVVVRTMTREEIMTLKSGDHAAVILNSGRLGTCKINGAIRTWKREPGRVEIPVKYGMYEYAVLSLEEALVRFVVEV
jgi:hypothetical protein